MSMIKVGCCGYPVSKARYFAEFDVVEIQSTFYKLPRDETAAKWRGEAPTGFEFIVKAWQAITHPWSYPTWRRYGKNPPPGNPENYGFLRFTDENINAWSRISEICNLLGAEKVLIQLPPRLKLDKDNIEGIRGFIIYMSRSGFSLIIEPRHASWSDPNMKEFFQEYNIVHCVDPFKGVPWKTGDFYYLRLHGIDGYNYGHKYSDDELKELYDLISTLDIGRDIYVMFNNKYMFDDAIRFRSFVYKR